MYGGTLGVPSESSKIQLIRATYIEYIRLNTLVLTRKLPSCLLAFIPLRGVLQAGREMQSTLFYPAVNLCASIMTYIARYAHGCNSGMNIMIASNHFSE